MYCYKMERNKNYKIAIKVKFNKSLKQLVLRYYTERPMTLWITFGLQEIRKLAPVSPKLLSPKARGHHAGRDVATVHGPFHFFEDDAGFDKTTDIVLQKKNTAPILPDINQTEPQKNDLNKLQV